MQMKKLILLSTLGLVTNVARSELIINTALDTQTILGNQQTDDDLTITGEGPYATGTGSGTDPSRYLHGYSVSNGATLENVNIINLNAKYDSGILLSSNANAINSGTINVNNTNSLGILSSDGKGNILNTSTGIINLNDVGTAIASKAYGGTIFTGLIQNDGEIVAKKGGAGITAYASQYSKGGDIINNGSIKLGDGDYGTGISVSGYVTVQNNGEISGSSINTNTSNALLAGTDGAQLYNNAMGTLVGQKNVSGMYAQNTSATNRTQVNNAGLIEVDKGNGIYSLGADVVNNGIVSSNKVGIYLTKFVNSDEISTLVNNGTVIVNQGSTGISSGQAIAENNGLIQITGSNVTAVYAYNGSNLRSVFTNNAAISADADKTNVTLFRLSGDRAVGNQTTTLNNSAALTTLGNNSIAIYSTSGSKIHNTGEITVQNGIGIKLENASLLEGDNQGKITVTGSGIGIRAASTSGGLNMINNGAIDLESNGTAIYIASNSTYLNTTAGENKGTISFHGEGGTGIYVTDNQSSFINNAELVSDQAQTTGMLVTQNAVITNNAEMTLTGADSIGIRVINTGELVSNTGTINVNDGIGIKLEGATLHTNQNTGIINVNGDDGVGIKGNDFSSITNNGLINVTRAGTGIYATEYSSITNYGDINIADGTGILLDMYSGLINYATLNVTEGGRGIAGYNATIVNDATGMITTSRSSQTPSARSLNRSLDLSDAAIYADHSVVSNIGGITAVSGNGVVLENNSTLVNTGTITAAKLGVYGDTSTIDNSGTIESDDIGMYARNNLMTTNHGEITAKTGVVIESGTEIFSGHFLNTGTITGTDHAIQFEQGDSVLELQDGSVIQGKISGSVDSENILVVNGNVTVDTVDHFDKLVVSGNTELTGNLYLSPTTDDRYYTEAFGASKSLMDIASETKLGTLTVNGTIEIGVDYDGIVNETNKTGKIITERLNLQNGQIVLANGGTTSNSLITESGLTNLGDEIRIKSIVISNKQQAVNPDLQFQATGGMAENGAWTRDTVARIENGVTVLDAVYTKTSLDPTNPINPKFPTDPENPTDPDSPVDPKSPSDPQKFVPSPVYYGNFTVPLPEKRNSVPRSRVDLDNVIEIERVSQQFLDMASHGMQVGDKRVSVGYIGTKAGSDFRASDAYNYGYEIDSNGIMASILYQSTDSIVTGATLAFIKDTLDYENSTKGYYGKDGETVNSYNVNIFGRYTTGNWSFDGHFDYGYNQHDLKTDWLGLGKTTGEYQSKIFKTGVAVGYTKRFGDSNIQLTPRIGIDYVSVSEGTITTPGMSDIQSVRSDGFVGKVGLDVGNTSGKLLWNAGLGYEHNFADTFHGARKMNNRYTMEQLHYGKDNLYAHVDVGYQFTKHVMVKAGYQYTNNKNFKNNVAKLQLVIQ